MITHTELQTIGWLQQVVQDELSRRLREHRPSRLCWVIEEEEESPWLRLTVSAAEPTPLMALPWKFGLWRQTGSIYPIAEGAADDAPILTAVRNVDYGLLRRL